MATNSKQSILVGIDFTKSSENALKYAIMLAEKSNSTLLLFHVFDTPIVHTNSGAYFVEYASLKHNNLARLEKYKSEIQTKHPKLKMDVRTTFTSFKEEVKYLAKHGKINYVVLGLETKSKISKFIYGTTGVDIAGKIDCPVIIVPERYKAHRLENVVLAIDNKSKQHAVVLKKHMSFVKLHKCKNVNLHVRTEDELIIEKIKNKDLPVETIEAKDFKTGLVKYTKANEIDLVTLISHSHSFLYNMFAETNTKLIAFQSKIPVMSIHD